ncbi:MAG: hypothetical protein NXI12_02345 [Alphaproteobacteria bacterium]|nr:hypothetical protein [Alphaproteobacteria bacterium]
MPGFSPGDYASRKPSEDHTWWFTPEAPHYRFFSRHQVEENRWVGLADYEFKDGTSLPRTLGLIQNAFIIDNENRVVKQLIAKTMVQMESYIVRVDGADPVYLYTFRGDVHRLDVRNLELEFSHIIQKY